MDKRDQIIEVATALFAKNGFEKTPISAICEKVEISKGLVFHHFKNKNELLREVFINITKIIGEADKDYLAISQPKEMLVALIESIFGAMTIPEHRTIYQLNFSVMVHPATRAILLDLIDERTSMLQASTEEVFSNLSHENPAVVSRMFIAEIDGIALNYLLNDDFPIKQIKEEFIKKYC